MSGIVAQWNAASKQETVASTYSPMIPIAEFQIRNIKDVNAMAQRARLLGTLTDLAGRKRTAFGKAVREIAQNTVQHAGGGSIEFRLIRDNGGSFVEAAVSDSANNCAEIRSILDQETGPDCGLRRASGAVDRLKLEQFDGGKRVLITVSAGVESAGIDETVIAEWAGALRTRRTQSALASTQRRTRELTEQLASLQKQRQKLEADLQQSRSLNATLTLLSLVASKTDNAVIIMDEHGLATWANDAFIRMTGYSSQEVVGTRPDLLLSGPDTSSASLREVEQAFTLGHGVNEEFLQYRREGTTSWISLSLTPIHDDEGAVSRWIGIGTDITKRKEAEKALKSARDAAETASQLKGEFLANISHEIRTPMNSIIGMTDLALCTSLDDDQRDYLTTVKQSAESLLELLNDVLDLSKIESGRLEIEKSPFDLRRAINNTLKPLRFVAEQKGLQLNTSISSDIPVCIVSDSVRLRQILVNLVGNAIKFTSEGHVEVRVQKQWESDGEVGLQFTVADTGIGIAANKLDRIFEAFSQADSSITRQFGGTGLGLAITSQLLKLMQGRIWVQSERGCGSRFHFTLRTTVASEAEHDEAQADARAAISTDSANPFEQARRPLNVLVADDHPANRHLIARILEKRGHSMSFANNGHQVLTLFDEGSFDVILMDVQMPEMDGCQATVSIRERERETQSHVPIIAITAHAMQGDRENCLAAGMDAYLSKPISATELITLVDSLSDNQINVSVAAATSSGFSADNTDTRAQPEPGALNAAEPGKVQTTNSVELSSEGSILQDPPTFSAALERLDNDAELLREQMEFFLKDAPELLAILETSGKAADFGTLHIAAHRLKNLCASFEDDKTAAECRKLEYANDLAALCTDATVAGVRRLLTTIQTFLSQNERNKTS